MANIFLKILEKLKLEMFMLELKELLLMEMIFIKKLLRNSETDI